jgi:hypothetical protein
MSVSLGAQKAKLSTKLSHERVDAGEGSISKSLLSTALKARKVICNSFGSSSMARSFLCVSRRCKRAWVVLGQRECTGKGLRLQVRGHDELNSFASAPKLSQRA